MQKTDCKNKIYTKNWVRRTWTAKVNGQSKSMAGQSQWSMVRQMTSQDDIEMTSADEWMLTQLGLTWHIWWRQRTKFWRVGARGGAWRRVKSIGGACQQRREFWWRVEARGRSDGDEISQKGRSKRLLSNGTTCGLIEEAEAVVAARLLKSGTPMD